MDDLIQIAQAPITVQVHCSGKLLNRNILILFLFYVTGYL